LVDFTLYIDSQNNFPHGTGIASSAAGFGALSLCLAHIEQLLLGDTSLQTLVGGMNFWQRSSYLSRIGSGSACRSMFAKPAVWGETHAVAGSSDLFAVELDFETHPSLSNWKDVVLIVDDGEKSVSSTAGHALLTNHPYAEARFGQAQKNLEGIVSSMKNGDVKSFIEIVESEALQLHSMMMTSIPYYVLMRPNTLAIIEQIWRFREQTGLSICFTLDAGANVHFLYDGKIEETVMNFVNNTLLQYCKNGQYLCSNTGKRPVEL
jgi:diphosphomevalonate decarboxylase